MRCPDCREVESQVCNLHAMDEVKPMRCLDCEASPRRICVEHARTDNLTDEEDLRIACSLSAIESLHAENRRLAERQARLARLLGVPDGGRYQNDWEETIARLRRERDEARQARRMAEEEVQQLRARIRGDAPAAAAPPPTLR